MPHALDHDPGYRIGARPAPGRYPSGTYPCPWALIAAFRWPVCPLTVLYSRLLAGQAAARRAHLLTLADDTHVVFYESSHRIEESLADLAECLGAEREAVIARN